MFKKREGEKEKIKEVMVILVYIYIYFFLALDATNRTFRVQSITLRNIV